MVLKIRQFRTQQGLTQGQLAKRSGIWREQINRYERGKMFPDLPTILKLCDALGCKVEDLVDADGETTAS